MIKLSGAFAKREDRSRAQCLAHYRDRHGPLVRSSAEFARYAERYDQHERLDWDTSLSSAATDICGVTQLWFETIDALREAYGSGVYQGPIRDDEHRFVNLSQAVIVIGEEQLLIGEAREAPLRLFRFIERNQHDCALTAYADRIATLEGAGRPAAFTRTASLPGDESPFGDAPVYAVLDELRFSSRPNLDAFASDNAAIMAELENAGMAMQVSVQLVTGFRRVIGDAPAAKDARPRDSRTSLLKERRTSNGPRQ